MINTCGFFLVQKNALGLNLTNLNVNQKFAFGAFAFKCA